MAQPAWMSGTPVEDAPSSKPAWMSGTPVDTAKPAWASGTPVEDEEDPISRARRIRQEITEKVTKGEGFTPGDEANLRKAIVESSLPEAQKSSQLARMGKGAAAIIPDVAEAAYQAVKGGIVAPIGLGLGKVTGSKSLEDASQKMIDKSLQKFDTTGAGQAVAGIGDLLSKAGGQMTADDSAVRDVVRSAAGIGMGAAQAVPDLAMALQGAAREVGDVFRTPEEEAAAEADRYVQQMKYMNLKRQLAPGAGDIADATSQIVQLAIPIPGANLAAKTAAKIGDKALSAGKIIAGGATQIAAKAAGNPLVQAGIAAATSTANPLMAAGGVLLRYADLGIRNPITKLLDTYPQYADDLGRLLRQSAGSDVVTTVKTQVPKLIDQVEREMAQAMKSPGMYSRIELRNLQNKKSFYEALATNAERFKAPLQMLEGEIKSGMQAGAQLAQAGAIGTAFAAPFAEVGQTDQLLPGVAMGVFPGMLGAGLSGRKGRADVLTDRYAAAGRKYAANSEFKDASNAGESALLQQKGGETALHTINAIRGAFKGTDVVVHTPESWSKLGAGDHPAFVDSAGIVHVNSGADAALVARKMGHEVWHTLADGKAKIVAPEMYAQLKREMSASLGEMGIAEFRKGYLRPLFADYVSGKKVTAAAKRVGKHLSPERLQQLAELDKLLAGMKDDLVKNAVPDDMLSEIAAEFSGIALEKGVGDIGLPTEFGELVNGAVNRTVGRWIPTKAFDYGRARGSRNALQTMRDILKRAMDAEDRDLGRAAPEPAPAVAPESPAMSAAEPVMSREVRDARATAANTLRALGFEADANAIDRVDADTVGLFDQWFDKMQKRRYSAERMNEALHKHSKGDPLTPMEKEMVAWDAIQRADAAQGIGNAPEHASPSSVRMTPADAATVEATAAEPAVSRSSRADVIAAEQRDPNIRAKIQLLAQTIKAGDALDIVYRAAEGEDIHNASNLERRVARKEQQPGDPRRGEYEKTIIPMTIWKSKDGNVLVSGYSVDKTILRNAQLFFERVNLAKLGLDAPYKDMVEVGRAIDQYAANHAAGYDAAGKPIPHRQQTAPQAPHQFTDLQRQFLNMMMGIESKDAAGRDVNPLREAINAKGAAELPTKDLFHPVWETLRVDEIVDLLGQQPTKVPDYPSMKRGYAPTPEKPLADARLTRDMGDQGKFLEAASMRRFGKPLQDVVLDPDASKFKALAQEWRDANSRHITMPDGTKVQQFAPTPEKKSSFFKRIKEHVSPEALPLKLHIGKDGNPVVNPKSGLLKAVPISYDLMGAPGLKEVRGDKAQRAKINAKNVEVASGKMVDFFGTIKDNPEIMGGIGWYGRMRDAFRDQFGASAELMSQLLGATSANTDVPSNFKFTVDLLRKHAKGDFDDVITRYDAHRAETQRKLEDGTLEREFVPTASKKKFDPDQAVYDANQKFISDEQNILRQDNGSQFGMNSKPALKALHGSWLEDVGAPKTPNFAGNLSGRTKEATIDVWAARNLRRLLYADKKPRWRIPPLAESGVTDPDFRFAQEVYRAAADKLGMSPDDLQAVIWFAEKKKWAENGWTGSSGEQLSSFDPHLAALDAERYQAGITTYTNADKFKLSEKAYTEAANRIREKIGKIPGIIASRVTKSEGYYGGKEPSLDIEWTVKKGSDVSAVVEEMAKIANGELTLDDPYLTRQSDFFVSRVVDEKHPNARPMIEVHFKTPLDDAALGKMQDYFMGLTDKSGNSPQGYTVARDQRGRAIGLRSQYVPEISATFDTPSRHLDPAEFAMRNEEQAKLMQFAIDKLSNSDSVADVRLTWVDTSVFGKGEYEYAGKIFRGEQVVPELPVTGGTAEKLGGRPQAGRRSGSISLDHHNRRRQLLAETAFEPDGGGRPLSGVNPPEAGPLADARITSGAGSAGDTGGGSVPRSNLEGHRPLGGDEASGAGSGVKRFAPRPLEGVTITKNEKIGSLARAALGHLLKKDGYSVPDEGKYSPHRVVPSGEEGVLYGRDNEIVLDAMLPKDEFAQVKAAASTADKPYFEAVEQLRKVLKPIPNAAEAYIEKSLSEGQGLGEGSEAFVVPYPGDKTSIIKVFKSPLSNTRTAVRARDNTVQLIADGVGVVENINRVNRYNALPDTVPLEILGLNQEGQLVAKQQMMKQDAQPGAKEKWLDQQVRNMNAVVMNTRQPPSLELGIGKELIPEAWENQPFIKDANGNWYSVMDLRDGNFMEDASGKAYLIDALPHPISNADIDRIPEALRKDYEQFRPKDEKNFKFAPTPENPVPKSNPALRRPLENIKIAQPGARGPYQDDRQRRRSPLAGVSLAP